MAKFIEWIKENKSIFNCQMCGTNSNHKYLRYPHPAIIDLIKDKTPQVICKKCAKREIGPKNKLEWDKIHG